MLSTLDLDQRLEKSEYRERLLRGQLAMRRLAYQLYLERRSLILVYEGWDAAGKGGNIRRLREKLDPRGYHVYSISAPHGDDRQHHYLWRFWRRLRPPEEKQVLIFDRSWYGRVLVERVEGFAREDEWRRAYREINDFERQLVESKALVVKFWIHIGKEEQLRRFEERNRTPHKRWKLTDEDWRNRGKWEEYSTAVEEMLVKTSTLYAPWVVLEGNDKYFARVKAVEYVVTVLEDALGAGKQGKTKGKAKGKKA